MKILLLGEFSGLHGNLKAGLSKLGHEVHLASGGDGWKGMPMDINIGSYGEGGISKIKRISIPFLKLKQLQGFDIVQLISPYVFWPRFGVNRYLMRRVIESSGKAFYCACGSDYYYNSTADSEQRYSPIKDEKKFDYPLGKGYWDDANFKRDNEFLIDRVRGVSAIAYDYYRSYLHSKVPLQFIPIPINTETITYEENVIQQDRIVVFHGVNRYGFKGTRHIEKAFQMLRDKYPNDLELIMADRLPFDQYVQIIRRANVVVDQTYSYSPGLNALISMAMGKIVLTGAEPEFLQLMNLNESPIINILPDPGNIVQKIENLIEVRANISKLGAASRQYVLDHHDHVSIAKNHLKFWDRS